MKGLSRLKLIILGKEKVLLSTFYGIYDSLEDIFSSFPKLCDHILLHEMTGSHLLPLAPFVQLVRLLTSVLLMSWLAFAR